MTKKNILNFKIINDTVVTKSLDSDDTLYIHGIANSGLEDIMGDTVTPEALDSIVSQALNRNLHLDHDWSLEGVIGTITAAEVTEKGAEITARILNEKKQIVQSLLDQGVKLGLSIGGCSTYEENNYSNIVDYTLVEISLTPIPCDQNTMGGVVVVKSFKELDSNIKNKFGGKNMPTENNEETITKDNVIELINTAFSEKQDEIVTAVIEQVKTEFGAVIEDLGKRVETLEKKDPNADKDESTEGKPGKEGGETGADTSGTEDSKECKPGDPEEEDPNKKSINIESIKSVVHEELSEFLADMKGIPSNPNFKYQNKNHDDNNKDNKTFTIHEIAEL